jgi:hypothetical protein
MKIHKRMTSALTITIVFLVLPGTSAAQREDSQEDIREEQIRERNEERRSSLLEQFQIIRWIRQKKSAAKLREGESRNIEEEEENEIP